MLRSLLRRPRSRPRKRGLRPLCLPLLLLHRWPRVLRPLLQADRRHRRRSRRKLPKRPRERGLPRRQRLLLHLPLHQSAPHLRLGLLHRRGSHLATKRPQERGPSWETRPALLDRASKTAERLPRRRHQTPRPQSKKQEGQKRQEERVGDEGRNRSLTTQGSPREVRSCVRNSDVSTSRLRVLRHRRRPPPRRR
jgi:hypothetical protein